MVKNGSTISTRKLCREILKIPKEELLALLADRQSYYQPYEKRKPKSDGSIKIRDIEPPYGYLKAVLKKIDGNILQPALESLPYGVMGGRKGYSVVDNARYHSQSKALMKYDVKDFFPSIKYADVFHIFCFQLNYCEEAANILAHLTTFESDKHGVHVPQGSPTSMSIANLTLSKLSHELDEYCTANNLRFSTWVDDITISGSYADLKKHRPHINYLTKSTHYFINPDKDTGIIQKGSKIDDKEKGRKVTGITIANDNQLTLGHKKLSQIRKQLAKSKKPSDKLRGRIQFLRQVNPSQAKRLVHDYKEKHG